ncbi:MAG TPA: asparagine synthase-related protein, partial [Pilimelia sp.]|nr:asparagine synthase-related protein [Pilimelia sp.]
TTDEGTPWRGVYRLPPGHLLTAGPGRGPDIRRWHSPAVPTRPATVAEAVEELRDRLTAVVADYVPATGAGVLVSGGIDSNSVLAVARRVAGTDRPVVGCSLVFPGEPHDESPWLDHLDRMAPEPVRRLLPPPYDWAGWRAWSAATLLPPLRPNAALAESAADVLHAHGIGTVLTGEGGDDWFGGGPLHWPGLARRGRLAGIWRSARRANGTTRHTASAVWGAGLRPLLPHARRTIVPPWLRADFVHRTQLADRLAASDAATRRASADPQSLRHRRATMPYGEWQREIIRDRHASRGLDWRHPLHDQRVIELLLGLPGDVLWRPGETKSLLRAAVADIAPPDIVRRQSKTSFAPPIAAAIRATGGARALAGHPLVTNGYVDLDAFVAGEDAALRCHDAGRPPPGPHAGLGAVWAVHSTATWFTAVGLS